MKMLKVSIILMVAVLAVSAVSLAAPIPAGSITDNLTEPSRVALDAQGNVYVSEPAHNTVKKFDAQGKLLGSFPVERPYGIAVSASGAIYVCSAQVPQKKNHYVNKSAVYIYASDFTRTGALGAGEGEFGAPVDVDIDSAGNVYVVDTEKNVVKVFTSAGSSVSSFGGLGNTLGKLNKPMGISINDAAGAIYVVDKPDYTDVNGTTVGARVQTFDMNGVAVGSFGQYGEGVGQITSPVDVAFDRSGNLYVSDSRQNQVHIFNASDGSYLGNILVEYAYAPAGLEASKNGLLYVVWQNTAKEHGRVDRFGLDGYVTMDVTPASLAFESRQFGGNPAAQTVVIANAGSGTLNWNAAADQSWITLGTRTAVGPQSSAGLSVSVDAAKTPGVYSGTITITSDFGQTATVGVQLTVLQPLMLNISNGSPTFTIKSGSAPASQAVTIGIDGGAGTWSINTDGLPAWLTISPTSGASAPTAVTFTADPSLQAVTGRTEVANVIVAAPGVTGDGSAISVSLTVLSSTKISVTTNRSDASFQVSGPVVYAGRGMSWSVNDAPAGAYTVTYDAVAGYKKPAVQSKVLAENGAVAFNGAYVSFEELAAKKKIVVAQGPGANNDSRVKVYKNSGAIVPFDLVALGTMYGANVAAGDVDGDGGAELIAGAGSGQNNPAVVRIIRPADKSLIAEFTPFGTLSGARVAAGDLDGDGKAEVMVSVSENGGRTAVYALVDGKMIFTGLEIDGTVAAAADTEGDGASEILAATTSGVTVSKVDASGGMGHWTASVVRTLALEATSLAAADTDGDGIDEIVIGKNGIAAEESTVTVVKATGSMRTIETFDKHGVTVAAADLDGDGKAEIIAGAGAQKGAAAASAPAAGKMNKRDGHEDGRTEDGNSDHEDGTVRVYGADGRIKFEIKAVDHAKDGVNVAVGDLGL